MINSLGQVAQTWALPFLCLAFFIACLVISSLDFHKRKTVDSTGLLALSIIGVFYSLTWLVVTYNQATQSRVQYIVQDNTHPQTLPAEVHHSHPQQYLSRSAPTVPRNQYINL